MNAKTLKIFVFFLLPVSFLLNASEIATNQNEIQYWKTKNAKLWLGETGLKVLAEIDNPRPVLTIDNVTKTSKFTVKVQLKVTNPGSVGIKWIMDKGAESEKPMAVYKKVKPKDGYQSVTISVPVTGLATDFQLLTPWGDCTIKDIHFIGGGSDEVWTFVEPVKKSG